jgi:hypothetical protein
MKRYWISMGQAKFADREYSHFEAINAALSQRRPFSMLDCEESQRKFKPVWILF